MQTKFVFLIVSLLGCLAASAQNPFKVERKVYSNMENPYARITPATKADSFMNVWRFTANFSPGAYTFGGTYQVMAGAEFGYQHQRWDYAAQKYKVIWSINGAWFPINSANKVQSLKDLSSIGVTFGFNNNLFQFGPMWNPNAPNGQQFGVLFTFGYTLNN